MGRGVREEPSLDRDPEGVPLTCLTFLRTERNIPTGRGTLAVVAGRRKGARFIERRSFPEGAWTSHQLPFLLLFLPSLFFEPPCFPCLWLEDPPAELLQPCAPWRSDKQIAHWCRWLRLRPQKPLPWQILHEPSWKPRHNSCDGELLLCVFQLDCPPFGFGCCLCG